MSLILHLCLFCTVPKTKGWRWFKAIWNGFFPFTWRKRRKSAKLQRFSRPWTEKYIPYYIEPAPAVMFWNSVPGESAVGTNPVLKRTVVRDFLPLGFFMDLLYVGPRFQDYKDFDLFKISYSFFRRIGAVGYSGYSKKIIIKDSKNNNIIP